MNNSDFKFDSGKIFSLVTGDLVATVDERGLKMQPGKNALTPKVKAFWETYSATAAATETQESSATPEFEAQPAAAAPDPSAAFQEEEEEEEEEEVNTHLLNDHREETFFFGGVPEKGGTSAPARETPVEKSAADNSPEIRMVRDIPESYLPFFSPALGVSTPEFKAFVKKHKFSKAQVIELVRRLEIIQSKKEN